MAHGMDAASVEVASRVAIDNGMPQPTEKGRKAHAPPQHVVTVFSCCQRSVGDLAVVVEVEELPKKQPIAGS